MGTAFAKAQSNVPLKATDSINEPHRYYFIDGDSLSKIELQRVTLIQSLRFSSTYENIRYQILKRKVRKVWPYAVLAGERLSVLNERLALLEFENDKKRYTRMIQKYIEEELTAELKKLTKTEGQILVKLIYRQTGITTFDLVKDLRSGWSAFWYQQTASLFNIDLKATYEPETEVEDFYIEDILQQEFKYERLEEHSSVLDFDYFKGRAMWNTYEDHLPANYDSLKLAERAAKRKKYLKKKARKKSRNR